MNMYFYVLWVCEYASIYAHTYNRKKQYVFKRDKALTILGFRLYTEILTG